MDQGSQDQHLAMVVAAGGAAAVSRMLLPAAYWSLVFLSSHLLNSSSWQTFCPFQSQYAVFFCVISVFYPVFWYILHLQDRNTLNLSQSESDWVCSQGSDRFWPLGPHMVECCLLVGWAKLLLKTRETLIHLEVYMHLFCTHTATPFITRVKFQANTHPLWHLCGFP